MCVFSNRVYIFVKSAFSLHFMLLLTVIAARSPSLAQEVERVWQKGVYKVDTIPLAKQAKARWIVFNPDNGDYMHGTDDAKSLLDHFVKQPIERQKYGIFIYSDTFAIPDTVEARKWMNDSLMKRYRNPDWRKSESNLIEELRQACEKRKILLYVNTSFNLNGKWRVLNSPDKARR